MLGFGTMRLPQLPDKTVDVEMTRRMIDTAIRSGVNYFDTAAPYHDGKSEVVTGQILKDYPRDSWYLADKYPGHQHSASFNPAETFGKQLQKCGVDYFDFYLMHNMCENSLETYMNPEWGILDYFVEQKKQGRIRHLGFSSHAEPAVLRQILESPYGRHMEFCQIQLNYLDWTLQDARQKCEILAEYGIPVWVMEPVRGGLLAAPGAAAEERMAALRPGCSPASWAFRYLQGLPGVKVILSGMSAPEQVSDNLRTFESPDPLSEKELALLDEVAAEIMKDRVPCTGCRYCTDVCPQGLDIPMFMSSYNDLAVQSSFTALMRIEALPAELQPSACLGCGACMQICPQSIQIPDTIQSLRDKLASMPTWREICRQREMIARQE